MKNKSLILYFKKNHRSKNSSSHNVERPKSGLQNFPCPPLCLIRKYAPTLGCIGLRTNIGKFFNFLRDATTRWI